MLVLNRVNDNHLQHFEYGMVYYFLDACRSVPAMDMRLYVVQRFSMVFIDVPDPEFGIPGVVFYQAFLSGFPQCKLRFSRTREDLIAKITDALQIFLAPFYIYLVRCQNNGLCTFAKHMHELKEIIIIRLRAYFCPVQRVLYLAQLDSKTCKLFMNDFRKLFFCRLHPFRKRCEVSFQYAQDPVVNLLFQEFYVILRVSC